MSEESDNTYGRKLHHGRARLESITQRLIAAGVVDVKFTVSPALKLIPDADRSNKLAHDLSEILEGYLEGRTTNVKRYDPLVGFIGASEEEQRAHKEVVRASKEAIESSKSKFDNPVGPFVKEQRPDPQPTDEINAHVHAARLDDHRANPKPPTEERLSWIVSMMYDLGMYTQALEIQRLGDAYFPLARQARNINDF